MLIALILTIFTLIPITFILLGYFFSTRPHSGPETKHFRNGTFHNPGGVKPKGLRDVFKFLSTRDPQPWVKNYEVDVREEPIQDYLGNGMRLFFINHSSFLFQFKSLNILVDPIWSERCSPVSWAGPGRMRPPGIAFEALPRIDLVLISHNHYDHLDIPTVIRLKEKFDPMIIVPLGVKDFLDGKGFRQVIELDWEEEHIHSFLNIRSMPAIHFSGRGMFDRNKSLWCGYFLETTDFKCYYVGDTGYGGIFRELSGKIGPVDLSLIPIGAYMPRWMMSPIHLSPLEAVQVHKDLRSDQSVAMHFGCFPLGDEGQGGAEKDLISALNEAGIGQNEFLIPDEGKEYHLQRASDKFLEQED